MANSCKNGAFFVNFKHFSENFKDVENIEKPHNSAVSCCYAVLQLVEARGVEPLNYELSAALLSVF